MEADKRLKLDEEGYTYVFESKMTPTPSKFRRKIWQVVPTVCATLVCIPYGIMAGWPSPMYPSLTSPDHPLHITMDQSAMVAGFLMIGNTVGTPFSSLRRFGSKYGIIIGVVTMTMGWITMWQARDIYYLLGSRFLVGAGNGFATGQLKFYIFEICQESLARFLIKLVNLYVLSGVVLAFCFGPFVDFTQFSIIATIISILVLFLSVFLPSTPRELVKSDKTKDAKKLIAFLSPDLDVDAEMKKVKERLHTLNRDLSFCEILKNSSLRKNFTIFAFLVCFQQFSGAPATVTYSQILLTRAGCPRPELCALVYALTFFLANIYGVFCLPEKNKRVLLFSTIGVSVLIVFQIVVLAEKLNEAWNYTSLVVLLFYIVVHTVGLGSVPLKLISVMFPKEAVNVVTRFYVMANSMFALVITKIFQVTMHQIGLFAPFCLFLVISTFSIVFVIVFVPSDSKSENT